MLLAITALLVLQSKVNGSMVKEVECKRDVSVVMRACSMETGICRRSPEECLSH